jgi:hypothetical protein
VDLARNACLQSTYSSDCERAKARRSAVRGARACVNWF